MSEKIMGSENPADDFIDIEHKLYGPIALLRTVWQALSNPESLDTYGIGYCLNVLEAATDQVREVQKHVRERALDLVEKE